MGIEFVREPDLRRSRETAGLLEDRTTTYSLTVKGARSTITRSLILAVLRSTPAAVIPNFRRRAGRLDRLFFRATSCAVPNAAQQRTGDDRSNQGDMCHAKKHQVNPQFILSIIR